MRVGETRVPLDAVIVAFRSGETAEGIVEQYPTLRLDDVYFILGYYLDNRRVVDAYLAVHQHEAERLRGEIEANFDPTGIRARLLAELRSRLFRPTTIAPPAVDALTSPLELQAWVIRYGPEKGLNARGPNKWPSAPVLSRLRAMPG